MAAAGAIRRRHSPDGSIQWLPVKPRMCSIGWCTPHCTTASAWPSKRPAISLNCLPLSIICLHITVAKDLVMAAYCLYSCYKPTRILWAPTINNECRFRHHFFVAGKWFIKNLSSSRIKLSKRLFYWFIWNQAKAPSDDPYWRSFLCWIGLIHWSNNLGGANNSPQWRCLWYVLCWWWPQYCTIPTVGVPRGRSFLFLPEPL